MRVIVAFLTACLVLAVLGCKQEAVMKSLPVYGMAGNATLEERIATSKVIARARFVSAEPDAVVTNFSSGAYHASLKYTFRVLEYLKGSGGTKIVAYAYGGGDQYSPYVDNNRNTARELAKPLLEARDTRWDDRETLIFLRYNKKYERHWLGFIDARFPNYMNVTVVSGEYKAVLPDVATSTAASGSSDQTFHMEDPDWGPGIDLRASTSTQPRPTTVTKSAVVAKIAEVDAWVRSSGGGEAVEECIQRAFFSLRLASQGSGKYKRWDNTIGSGQPADTEVYKFYWTDIVDESWMDLPEEKRSVTWYEGRDAGLFGFRYPDGATVKRPLPAGEYRFFENGQQSVFRPCNFIEENWRNKDEHFVTVTAPAGTLAESFFDPYASSTAIVGTTTVGTISWQSGEVTAALTRSVTGHVLDFIDLKGATTLSLIVADAAEDATGALTWTVPIQPWRAGDKLMLRVRKNGAP